MEQNPLVKEKLRKLDELRKLGVEPYPYNYNKTHSTDDILSKHSKLNPEEITNDIVAVAGRIMTLRDMGKAAFCHIQDEFGKIQIYLRQDQLKNFNILKLLDLGDIIGIKGKVFKTKTGEISVWAEELILLTKSVNPLPEKFHGLKDVETRYRQRYVDLITNPEARAIFKIRTAMVKSFRAYLDEKGFLEVETPTLQPIYGGANAKPFETFHNELKSKLFLRISNELYLKRLLVGGFEKVYEFVKDFRNEGIDTTHNPEFTQIEWYMAYADYNEGMKMFEEVVSKTAKEVLGTTKINYQGKEIDLEAPWKRMKMVDAIKEYSGLDVEKMSQQELLKHCKDEGIEYKSDSKGMLIQAIFEAKCEEHLIQPTFIIDHPIETTPLCKTLRDGNKEFVERFEPYINGWEIGNAYSELNDPVLQKSLLLEQVERGRGGEEETHPMDDDFINAIEYGMPPTSGVGVGFDRLVMLFTNSASIRDVLLFPLLKPEN